jgi:diguanylate cyclase (GGDEF)-like protein/PAS domain S-box-containing protein
MSESCLTVLVVDDHEDNRVLLKTLLNGLGHAALEATNGRQALEALRSGPCDLIVSDILMPVMDGYQLCREVRGDERLRHLPFIFYTATYVDTRDEEFARTLGADRFLRKPMDPQEFIGHLRAVMEEVAADRDAARPRPPANEKEILKLYNERLVRKLEKKMLDLEREMRERERMEAALKKSEEKYRNLVDQASDAIYILGPDARILDVNPAACAILQRVREELVGMDITTLIPPEDLERQPLVLPVLLKGQAMLFERLLRRKDGTTVPLEISAKAFDDGRIQCIARDITERKRAEAALRDSEERYALAARGANDGLWDWDLKTGGVYFSPRWKAMLGCAEGEIGNRSEDWLDRVHPDDLVHLKAQLAAHLDGVVPHFEDEHRILHADGAYRWVIVRGLAIRDERLAPTRMAGSMTDVTTRKRAEEQLLHDAFHDGLTGLANRALLADRLGQACERAKRTGERDYAVLHIDLDRFKVINESLGHAVGDQVLRAASTRILGCLRPGDTLARFAGDEFLALLEGVRDLGEVNRIAESIQKSLARPILLEGHEVMTTASIGVVLGQGGHERPEDALRDVHLAMHKAKAKGRAGVEVFDAELHAQAMARLRTEAALRRALERREFQVFYQPVIDLRTARLTGLEALVRWDHPEQGILAPAEFLSIAEEAGFLVAIDRLVLAAACGHLRQWMDRDPGLADLKVSVNFCSRQFSEPDLVEFVSNVLARHRLEARQLCIEITESALMESIERTQSVLFRLQAMGVRLHIDDFGTGYSSLSYLHHFPIDMLKIDRSFIGQMASPGGKVPIVQTIISLGHTMGMQVLAEGVENGDQLAALRKLDCNCAQGFFFSRPVDVVETEALLRPGRTWL